MTTTQMNMINTNTQTMNNTYTDTFDWLNEGDVTVYDYLSMINVTPLSITEDEGTNFPGYKITFKSFDDIMTFCRGYYGDHSDEEIKEIYGW
jgi:hypothetical protein